MHPTYTPKTQIFVKKIKKIPKVIFKVRENETYTLLNAKIFCFFAKSWIVYYLPVKSGLAIMRTMTFRKFWLLKAFWVVNHYCANFLEIFPDVLGLDEGWVHLVVDDILVVFEF